MLVLSLFPGIGLLDMAFEMEGFCVVHSGGDNCQRCGCTKPCDCDGYTQAMDHTDCPLSWREYGNDDPEFSA